MQEECHHDALPRRDGQAENQTSRRLPSHPAYPGWAKAPKNVWEDVEEQTPRKADLRKYIINLNTTSKHVNKSYCYIINSECFIAFF